MDLPSTAAGYGAVEIFTEAVEKARQGIKQNLAGSGEVSEAVNLKLSIDLKSKGLEDLPDEVVDIVKRDVERYVIMSAILLLMPADLSAPKMSYTNLGQELTLIPA